MAPMRIVVLCLIALAMLVRAPSATAQDEDAANPYESGGDGVIETQGAIYSALGLAAHFREIEKEGKP